jgi:hypothetical protein
MGFLADTPTVKIERPPQAQTVRVVGIDEANLKALAAVKWDAARWDALLAVYLDRRRPGADDQPAMLGHHYVKGGVLIFAPRFPFAPGSHYRAVFDPSRLPVPPATKKPALSLRFSDARPPRPPTVVSQVYPTADRLPENQLKFYLHFSAPMKRGDVYKHIKLLGPDNKEVRWPFLELDQELWNPDGTRFTLFFDPGRIKRGLKPREEVGPALEEGKKYTLVIDKSWRDANDAPLQAAFRKTFTVGPPDDTCPDPKKWRLQPPAAGSRAALTVRLDKPLDHALLQHMLRVTDAAGRELEGTITLSERETRWQFTPKGTWKAGDYSLEADTRLEDLAGNSIGKPFEVDVLRRIDRTIKKKTVRIAFKVSVR